MPKTLDMPEIHCLGTGGYHPNELRQTSCYAIPQWGVVLDAGTGIFRLPSLIRSDRLDILLSHAHLDHIFGLTVLLENQIVRPVDRIVVWVEPSKRRAIETHLFDRSIFPAAVDIEFEDLHVGTPVHLDHCSVDTYPQEHPGGSLAFRLAGHDASETTPSIVYATDTTGDTSEEFSRWCDHPDVLLHECNFTDDHIELAQRTGHTHTGRLAEVLRNVSARRVVVTHLNSLSREDDPVGLEQLCDQANLRDGQCVIATDGLRI